MSEPAESPAARFARALSIVAVSAPVFGVLVTVVVRSVSGDDTATLAMVAHLNVAVVGLGFVAGLVGLFVAISARVGRSAFRSLAGIVFNGFALVWALEAFGRS